MLIFTNPKMNTKYFGIAASLPATCLLNKVHLFLSLDYNPIESVQQNIVFIFTLSLLLHI